MRRRIVTDFIRGRRTRRTQVLATASVVPGVRKVALALTALCSVMLASGATSWQARAAGDPGPVGGVLLDGWGGVHPFGGFALRNRSGAPYWRGWDIARGVQVLADGSGGWTLEGWGGIHAWGAAPRVYPTAYWRGWDIARAFEVLPDHRSGYVLDGFGGLHGFGPNAPRMSGVPYFGWDIARGVDIHVNAAGVADGGAELDGWGGLHPFGNYQLQGRDRYFPGHSVYRQLHSVDGKQYVYAAWGIATRLTFTLHPYWGGLPNWSGWNIERDLQLFGSNNPADQAQPVDPYDWNEYLNAAGQPSDVGYRPECHIGPGVRYAAAQVFAVSIACQAMTVYGRGQPVMDTFVTTGRASFPTPDGWHRIVWKHSPWGVYRNFPSHYPVTRVQFAMAFDYHGDLFHDSAWEPSYEYGRVSTLYTSNASHGCVHVPRPQLDHLYAWTAVGATVYVN